MKKYLPLLWLVLISACPACKRPHGGMIHDDTAGLVDFRCLPFDLGDVELLDGPFLHATRLNEQSLLNYEPDRLLAKFRIEAGLEPKAEHYHGWEDNTIAGHSLGHYLSACALMYRTTADERFLERVNYIVGELAECQAAIGNGYIGAIPGGKKILEEEVARGDIRAGPFDLNGIWVPFYTMHKIMAGLRDAYHHCDNSSALEIEKQLGDWIGATFSGLSDEQMQKILSCEHGGINEVLADLYWDTGNSEYLELSHRFHHHAILDPLSRGEDILAGKHGNTQIPKLIGLARRYELTGDETDRRTAEFFWDRVVHHHSYVNGSHGNHEYFGPPDSLSNRLSSNTSESCNVYNMLKLTKHLFEWEASPGAAGFYERALLNHILSSQNPEDGRVLYFHSLQMGGHKSFQDPFWFTCCIGTGMENHSKYGGAIYYHSDAELFITQFIASNLHWRDKGLILRQATAFPEEQGTHLEILNDAPVDATLMLRYPSWAGRDFSVTVNGKKIRIRKSPGSFIPVRRKWQRGDLVEIRLPFSLRLEPMPDNPDRVAICYGPLVLAGDLGPADDSLAEDPLYVPGLVTSNRDPSAWLIPSPEEPNTFVTKGVGKPEDAVLRPLYKLYDRNYTVYWDVYGTGDWEQHLKEIDRIKDHQEDIARHTMDRVLPVREGHARSHGFRAETPGIYDFNGETCVESRSGWFSWDLKVEPGRPAGLLVDYWGGFLGPKQFDVLVNGERIATEDFSELKENRRSEIRYNIPAELTAGGSVTVKFAADENHYAGPVFGVRTIHIE